MFNGIDIKDESIMRLYKNVNTICYVILLGILPKKLPHHIFIYPFVT